MKKLIFSFVFILNLYLFSAENCVAQWVQLNCPYLGDIYSICGNDLYILIGIEGNGILRSTNYGNNWTQTDITNNDIWCILLNNETVFSGKGNTGVYKSTNNGINWLQTSLNNKSIFCLTITGVNIFAGSSQYGVFHSSNNGINWTQTSLNNKTIYSLTSSGSKIIAGLYNLGGVYISTNNGTNWIQTTLNNKSISSLAISNSNIFAGTVGDGVYLSTNDGSTWTQTSLNNLTVYSLIINGNYLFAGTENGIFLTTNNGLNWIQKNQGFDTVRSVGELFIANNYIFAGTFEQSIWRRPLSEIIGIQKISSEVPTKYSLLQNYPNPFNPSTIIRYEIPKSCFVKLVIYDILGKEVEILVNEKQNEGTYEVTFYVSKYQSGVYFYKLETENYSETKKMLLIK